HDAIGMRARGNLRRESCAQTVPDHEYLVAIHLGLSSEQRDRGDRVVDYLSVDIDCSQLTRMREGALVVSQHDDSLRAQPLGNILERTIRENVLVAIMGAG